MKKPRKSPIVGLNIRLDRHLLAAVDRKARHAKISREGFIRSLFERATHVRSKRRPAKHLAHSTAAASK